jgi:hypothetical protein
VADWVVISSLATAGGTLGLAGTTYASVRSANRAARAAEQSMLADLRPLLIESSADDPTLRVNFLDADGIAAPGGGAGVELIDGRLYVVLSLRNVGRGIGVLHGGRLSAARFGATAEHAPLEEFHLLTRDIYIPSGKIGFWQIALRDPADEQGRALLDAVEQGSFAAEVLYGDYEGGQRVVTRFSVLREGGAWQLSAVRHWQIDRPDPR